MPGRHEAAIDTVPTITLEVLRKNSARCGEQRYGRESEVVEVGEGMIDGVG